MSKRKLNAMQAQIDSLQGRVSGLIKTVTELLPVRPMKPKLKTLDQSVFDKVEVKWQWAAIDKDGSLYLYAKKPDSAEDGFYLTLDSRLRLTFGGYDATSWQNSLIERDTTKELTGGDLCKAILKKQVYQPCFVSDVSESHAIERKQTAMIDKTYSGIQFTFRSGCNGWAYVVPINNMGEPLTAKDVGL